jgi:DNA-binding transcriptional MerR regulator/methylmalonyl-CoA mutase cobalamin-binding subunit
MSPTEEATVPRHPIGVVADRTNLSQDVLRVWERRYGVVEPGRSSSGQRLYSDADIERLRLLSLATGAGRSISLIAPLPTPELERMVREDTEARAAIPERDRAVEVVADVVEPAIQRAIALDGPGLDALLRRALVTTGLPSFLETVATPLLTRVGNEWHSGRLSPAQEHLASAVVQRVIMTAMQSVTAHPDAPNLVIATPAGERHELGAIIAAAAAAAEGWRITYLGADLPAGDIADSAIRSGAQAVGLSIIYIADRGRVMREIETLRARLPATISLFLGGAASLSLGRIEGVRPLPDLGELRSVLAEQKTVIG